MSDAAEPSEPTVFVQIHDDRDPELLSGSRLEDRLADRLPGLCDALSGIARELQARLTPPPGPDSGWRFTEFEVKVSLQVGLGSKFILVEGGGAVEATFKWTR